ncbi:DUF2147 domain-containing protein [Winogradskyella sp.]|uniref:DUF2147 domain-containing protein n=1 Tax=Winogradskyella sp. TaxID=1883156 RepID=UPI00260ECF86|nr:DUF2147 domain-containing protein [Winogradskyella sp.]
MKNKFIIVLAFIFTFNVASSQSILGKWKTIDDETGNEKSIVEIYEDDGKVYGKIVEILTENKKAVCSKCDGDKKNQPILNMVIIEGLEKDDDVYEGGTILNPENGKEYKCRLKIGEDQDTLQVRGYVAFFYKTQYWKRVN